MFPSQPQNCYKLNTPRRFLSRGHCLEPNTADNLWLKGWVTSMVEWWTGIRLVSLGRNFITLASVLDRDGMARSDKCDLVRRFQTSIPTLTFFILVTTYCTYKKEPELNEVHDLKGDFPIEGVTFERFSSKGAPLTSFQQVYLGGS